ncbi:hypothetical protein Tb11.01.0560 [Trypanosoma brucei brucei TREU927]|uniref:Uncharacterized protein n=1 Tax=Trypanosoma brucei brucei (strain 927/4 GUTat10.1) TaxID=185431 RepID=Q384M1_TRYB2|nr:hypothetical protein Tb11.01.0560 [Trypanosoma brucei brucei TREU927]EAN79760.1 hypothetical protein Tb11.01.0560 [Trypanosoma brucei brucei TREU927]
MLPQQWVPEQRVRESKANQRRSLAKRLAFIRLGKNVLNPSDAGHINVVSGSSTPYHRGKPRASSVPLMGNTAVLRLRHHTAQGSAASCWDTVFHLSVPGHVASVPSAVSSALRCCCPVMMFRMMYF